MEKFFNRSIKIKTIVVVFIFAMVFLANTGASAQCAMCKASAESNMKEQSNNYGAGLNKGILYLLTMPYLLAGVGVFIWYKHRKQYRQQE